MTFPEPIIPPFLGADVYGRVTPAAKPDMALTIPTVWACVSLLANAVSMLPLETFRRTATIPERIPDGPLLSSPSAGVTQSEWLQSVMLSALLRGNAYGRIAARDPYGRPTQIDLLNPDSVKPTMTDTGQLVYDVTTSVTGTVVRMSTADVWHLRGMTMPGAKVGLSPISYAAQTMGVDLSSRQFAADYFAGGGIPKAIITSDQDINQEQSVTIKEKWMAATRRREPMVMGAGLGYHSIQVTPEESQFLATQQHNVAQIARFFNVPAELVGGSSGNSNTYANVEQRGIEFLTYSVGPWLKRIEDTLFPCFSQPTYVKFDTKALLRTDAETQAKVRNQQLAGKYRTPTELRAQDDLPPLDDDQLKELNMVPLTVTPLGGVKALPGLKDPTTSAAAVPLDDGQQEGDAANA
jgi:HK97 family phage portal protein